MDKKCECPGERHQQEDQTRIQRQQKNKKHDTVQRILQQFKRNPKDRKYQDKKERFLITCMRNEVGDIEASRRCVANTFAKFYEDLYSGRNDESKDTMRFCWRWKMEILSKKNTIWSLKMRSTMTKRNKDLKSPGSKKEICGLQKESKQEISNGLTKRPQNGCAVSSTWSSNKIPWLPALGKRWRSKCCTQEKRSDEIRKRSHMLYLADVVHIFSTMLYNTAQQARQLPIFLTFVGFEKFRRRTI